MTMAVKARMSSENKSFKTNRGKMRTWPRRANPQSPRRSQAHLRVEHRQQVVAAVAAATVVMALERASEGLRPERS